MPRISRSKPQIPSLSKSSPGEEAAGKQMTPGNPAKTACGIQPFGVSGPQWRKKSCLGQHVKFTVTCNLKESHNVLSKFTVLCWAAFRAPPEPHAAACRPQVGHPCFTLFLP